MIKANEKHLRGTNAQRTNAQTHKRTKNRIGKPGGRHNENVPDPLRKKPRAEPPTPHKNNE